MGGCLLVVLRWWWWYVEEPTNRRQGTTTKREKEGAEISEMRNFGVVTEDSPKDTLKDNPRTFRMTDKLKDISL
ncbi:hypothetical protein niasHS_010057 [Heterodera schachtii]|uniref:Uncharacterized protein n=1 Tax=Heterodera schachtii TaxID=97005 RepID=A0ABD2IZ57_HETSC